MRAAPSPARAPSALSEGPFLDDGERARRTRTPPRPRGSRRSSGPRCRRPAARSPAPAAHRPVARSRRVAGRARGRRPTSLVPALRRGARGRPGLGHRPVGQPHGLELAGAAARAVLEKGCPLDLHPRAFAARPRGHHHPGPGPGGAVEGRDGHATGSCRGRPSPTTSAAGCSTRWRSSLRRPDGGAPDGAERVRPVLRRHRPVLVAHGRTDAGRQRVRRRARRGRPAGRRRARAGRAVRLARRHRSRPRLGQGGHPRPRGGGPGDRGHRPRRRPVDEIREQRRAAPRRHARRSGSTSTTTWSCTAARACPRTPTA